MQKMVLPHGSVSRNRPACLVHPCDRCPDPGRSALDPLSRSACLQLERDPDQLLHGCPERFPGRFDARGGAGGDDVFLSAQALPPGARLGVLGWVVCSGRFCLLHAALRGSPLPLVLGGACDPSHVAGVQPQHWIPVIGVPAAVPGGVLCADRLAGFPAAGRAVHVRRHADLWQPHPYAAGEDSWLAGVRAGHAVPPPRAPCVQPPLSGQEHGHVPDSLGQAFWHLSGGGSG